MQALSLRQKVKGLSKIIRIGVGSGPSALWQAHYTQEQLQAVGIASEFTIFTPKAGGGQVGVSGHNIPELEAALLRGDIQVAAHAMKCLPVRQPEGLAITAVSRREDPAEWLLIRRESLQKEFLFQLKEKAVVMASTPLRQAQLLDFRPDLSVQDSSGELPARLQQLQEGSFDAILLPAASLIRLKIDISEFQTVKFSPRELVPAPAQGVLAWQTCADDKATRRIFKALHQSDVSMLTNVERRIQSLWEDGLPAALGAYCERDAAGNYHVWAAWASSGQGPVKRVRLSQSTSHRLAERVVEALKV